MKLFLVFVFGCSVATAFPTLGNDTALINGVNGWFFPSKNGTFHWMDKPKFERLQAIQEKTRGFTLSLTPTNFYLYTKSNAKRSQQIYETDSSIKKSNFNPEHPTKFIIHGFLQAKSSSMNKDIRDSHLDIEECNVIVVSWARALSFDYFSSVAAVPKVGEKVARMIDYLALNHGMNMADVTVVGHSLGAHVAGYAGKNVKAGRIATIIGLDPALPGFDYSKPHKRLNADDADYVETVQTNGGVFGFLMPIGKAAFFPNGGESQPGCFEPICNHERSVAYYAEAVLKDNFAAVECENFESAVSKSCGTTYSTTRMVSEENAYAAKGIYYVPVNKNFPYGVMN